MPLPKATLESLAKDIVDKVDVGLVVVDAEDLIVHWNDFMERCSGTSRAQALGASLYAIFPELPQGWFEQKLRAVRTLRTAAFTSWRERPRVFSLVSDPLRPRPIEDCSEGPGPEPMVQDCVILPLVDESTEEVFAAILVHDRTELARAEARGQLLTQANTALEELARHDPLTRVYHRAAIEKALETALAEAHRTSKPLAALAVLIDDFGPLNDQNGCRVADEVLRYVAQTLRAGLGPSAVLGRLEGATFLVVVPERRESEAILLGQRLRFAVASAPIEVQDKRIKVTLSVGVAQVAAETDAAPLLERALAALGEAQRAGGNNTRVSRVR
jgi:diguanylate cyclase (GGDEF)-like protein/PAS domain S-box-containing protein